MSRAIVLILASLMLCVTTAVFAAGTEGAPAKVGIIKSVDVATKTFVVTFPARPLTIKVDVATLITLDGKPSTFEAAIKPEFKATVTYTKVGADRLASKVDVTAPHAK